MFSLIKKTFTLKHNQIELFVYDKLKQTNKTVLFIGVTHGEEPQGEFLIKKYMEKLNSSKETFSNNLLFIPCLNPDGKALGTRGNSNGVDINRNFKTQNWIKTEKNEFYSGEAPESEEETMFLSEVIEEYKPDFILSLHAPFRVVNFDGDAKIYAEEISKLTSYPVQEDIGYPTPGSFGTYAGVERKIPTITLELPENMSDEDLWEENKQVFDYVSNIKIK